MSLCLPFGKQSISLATATAAARATAFAIFTAAVVVEYIQVVHGIHLLSNRCLSINRVKKIGVQRASALQPYWLITFTSFSVVAVSGANLIIN
jgi:hypothetical protein